MDRINKTTLTINRTNKSRNRFETENFHWIRQHPTVLVLLFLDNGSRTFRCVVLLFVGRADGRTDERQQRSKKIETARFAANNYIHILHTTLKDLEVEKEVVGRSYSCRHCRET